MALPGGGVMTISLVGSPTVATNVTSLSVSPSAVGNLLVIITSGSATITTPSGGGVTTWSGSNYKPSFYANGLYSGVVTAVGAATITLSAMSDVIVLEFTGGGAGTWGSNTGGSGYQTASGTATATGYGTPVSAGQLMVGGIANQSSAIAGSTSGFTYATEATALAAWGVAPSTASQQATASQSASGRSAGQIGFWAFTPAPTYTVTFNANGGSGSMSAESSTIPMTLTANTFTRGGYTFAGWNTVAGGGGTAYADGATYNTAASVTLYAQWVANPSSNFFAFMGG